MYQFVTCQHNKERNYFSSKQQSMIYSTPILFIIGTSDTTITFTISVTHNQSTWLHAIIQKIIHVHIIGIHVAVHCVIFNNESKISPVSPVRWAHTVECGWRDHLKNSVPLTVTMCLRRKMKPEEEEEDKEGERERKE